MDDDINGSNGALDLREIGGRIRSMVETLGIEQTEFAVRVGVAYSTMRAYLSGTRAPSAEFLAGVYRAYGFLPSWLLTGLGPARQDGAASDEYVVIPVLGIQASGGHGIVNEPEAEYRAGGLCLRRDWLAARRLSPASLAVIRVRGSSMEPLLSDGDQVLIDRQDTQPRSGFVYVLRQGDELLVKHCQILPGGLLRVSSANAAYQSYDVDLAKAPDVQVIGRVVASMHEW